MKSELGVSDPFVLNFNPIDTPTEAEKAQTLLTKASRDAALVNAGIISPEEARGIADRFVSRTNRYSQSTVIWKRT